MYVEEFLRAICGPRSTGSFAFRPDDVVGGTQTFEAKIEVAAGAAERPRLGLPLDVVEQVLEPLAIDAAPLLVADHDALGRPAGDRPVHLRALALLVRQLARVAERLDDLGQPVLLAGELGAALGRVERAGHFEQRRGDVLL